MTRRRESLAARTRPLAAWPAFVALALQLLLPGCTNPFEPAQPAPPSGEQIEERFSSIEELLNTMAVGIQTKSTNGANAYIHAYAESTTTSQRAFRAFHDQAVKSAWLSGSNGQGAPEPWTLDLERRLHSQLSGIRQNSEYLFQWVYDSKDSPPDEEIPSGSGVWSVHRHYELQAATSAGGSEVIAAGFADMLMVKDGPRFFIFEWRDRVDPKYGVNPSVDQRTFTFWRLESQ